MLQRRPPREPLLAQPTRVPPHALAQRRAVPQPENRRRQLRVVTLVHRKNYEKPPYALGTSVEYADTELGRLGVLLCGDLFDAATVQRLDPRLALLLVPMSRSFAGSSPDPERWEREERQVYLDAVREAGCRMALVNALEAGTEECSFGGALVVSAGGGLLAESPHGSDQILVWDLEEPA